MSPPEMDRQREAREKRAINRYVPDSDYHENRYASALDKVIAPGAVWLDLGAGRQVHWGWLGASTRELSLRARLLLGADLVGPHIRRNKSLSAAVLADARWLPFRDRTFDVVSANMVVEHLELPVAVFTEVARLLRPGGLFVFSTPNRNNPVVRASAMVLSARARRSLSQAVERRDPAHIFPTWYRCNTPSDIATTASKAGLRVRQVDLFSSFPFSKEHPRLMWLEGNLIRLLRLEAFRAARSNIIAILERPA